MTDIRQGSQAAPAVLTGSPLRPALVLFLILTVITGILYPLLVTGIAQAIFPHQARGSLIVRQDRVVGSQLIGQSFTDPKHFWGRPSATTPQPYNGLASGGSNLGPLNSTLIESVQSRVTALQAAEPRNRVPVPVDLVTASGSGLDPDISLAAAYYQAPRVARARELTLGAVRALIASHARGRLLGIIGEPRVNVLELNLALDEMGNAKASAAPKPGARSG
jgi:potassium-transporting ATPase KdpC subunit